MTLRATAPGAGGGRIALGEVTGTVLPAALIRSFTHAGRDAGWVIRPTRRRPGPT